MPNQKNPRPMIHCCHCGEEFTPYRTTAKFCSSNCRGYSHLKEKREKARRAKRAKTVRDLKRKWRNATDRLERRKDKLQDALMDREEGIGNADRFEVAKRNLDAACPSLERTLRQIEGDAAKAGISMDTVKGSH